MLPHIVSFIPAQYPSPWPTWNRNVGNAHLCMSCMCVWIHYWLLIWATSLPRKECKKQSHSEWAMERWWNETKRQRKEQQGRWKWLACRPHYHLGEKLTVLQGHNPSLHISEHKSVQQTAMQLDPVLSPHISTAHGQMELRDVIGQNNMQDYKTRFSGCVRILIFS